ncbi:hypothetical protein [Streptomyces sp. TRM49041]|uniref:hypothetical protein n=1 Tax=Streptomyces sp. TRM49041 TaxID=2603216 RepID=UPI001656886F|nr:hypothetical protein [Streptomyces sp. TRM49041]
MSTVMDFANGSAELAEVDVRDEGGYAAAASVPVLATTQAVVAVARAVAVAYG